MCVFYLKTSKKDRKKKWQSLVDHYKASIVPCTFIPPSKSFTLYRERGGVDKYRTGWPGWCWQGKRVSPAAEVKILG